MNNEKQQKISVDDLIKIIGNQAVQIQILNQRIVDLQQETERGKEKKKESLK